MYNTTTRSYTMEDGSGSYAWIVENYEPADIQGMSDEAIYRWIDTLIEQAKESKMSLLDDLAESKAYPCFGYTTAQIFYTPDEWIAFKKQEIETDLSAEREHVFKYLKEWLEGQ